MAYDIILRRNSDRDFSRDRPIPSSLAPNTNGLLKLGILSSTILLFGYLGRKYIRRREIEEARVQYVDPFDEVTTKLTLNRSMADLMRRRAA